LNIHEYQAKQLLNKYGIKIPNGKVAHSPSEALRIAHDLKCETFVVKAQIHAGGRGKAGGIKIVKSPKEVGAAADQLIDSKLVTPQTGPNGKIVKKIYIEEGSNIEKEFYISMIVDRVTDGITIIASTEGGMEIEEVAEKTPEKIYTLSLEPNTEIKTNEAKKITTQLGVQNNLKTKVVDLILSLYKAMTSTDSLMIEINPLVTTKEGEVLALDAKIDFDENAFYRQQDIEELRDEDEEDPLELKAKRHDLNYVKLDGEIGVMVNGAGLAMATMDLIKLYGGVPANFMDIAGAATPERVAAAFKLLYSDKDVKGIFIKINFCI